MSIMSTIIAKIDAGERLSPDDGLFLLQEADLLEMGALANEVRFRRNPESIVSYVVDTNLNYTNVCDAYCTFCAFYRPHGTNADDAYTHSIDDMVAAIGAARDKGCTTVLMQGGLNPDLPFGFYTDMVRASLSAWPDVTPHFWSPPEIFKMSQVSGLTYLEVCRALWEAGQRTLPGGGAEVLNNRVRKAISPLKMNADDWIEVMRSAHEVGFTGTATMMYGHMERDRDIIEHLDRVRELQDERHAGRFSAFVPWSFSPGDTPLGRKIKRKRAGPNRYLRILALGRLYLDNIDHVDASWFSEGKKTGQIALHFGADDFGGTLFDENVMNEAGHYSRTTVEEIRIMIREAGFIPAQRNSKYEILQVFDETLEKVPARVTKRRAVPLATATSKG